MNAVKYRRSCKSNQLLSVIFKKRNTYYLQRGLCKAGSRFFFHEGKVSAACFLSIASTETQPSFFAPGKSWNRCELISLDKKSEAFIFIPDLNA